MPRSRMLAGVAAGLLAAALIAGCSGSGSKSASAPVASSGGVSMAGAAAPARAASEHSLVSTSSTRSDVVTASVAVTTARVDQAADRIGTLVATNQGRVDGDNRSSGDGLRTATVTVRVPPARLSTVIAGVDRLGTETGRRVTSTDVTTAKADVDARVLALSTSVTRLRHLLATAGSVTALLAVEKVLTSRQADLDSLRAQQRVLDDQIALATLTVSLRSRPPAAVKHRPFHATGFFTAVGKSVHGLGVAILVVVASVGYALPFAVPLAVIAAAVMVVRRRRHSAAGVASEPGAPDPA